MKTIILLYLVPIILTCDVCPKTEEKLPEKWETFLKCVKEIESVSQNYAKIIEALENNKLRLALFLTFKLIRQGDKEIKECFDKARKEINLQWDTVSILSCLQSIGYSVPCIVKIVGAVSSGCIPCLVPILATCGVSFVPVIMNCIGPMLK